MGKEKKHTKRKRTSSDHKVENSTEQNCTLPEKDNKERNAEEESQQESHTKRVKRSRGEEAKKEYKKEKQKKKKHKKKKLKKDKSTQKEKEIKDGDDKVETSCHSSTRVDSKDNAVLSTTVSSDDSSTGPTSRTTTIPPVVGRAIANSALDYKVKSKDDIIKDGITLVLFYQYMEPPWTSTEYSEALEYAQSSGDRYGLTGRMRVAKEGFNCTLTGTYDNVRQWCVALRQWKPNPFKQTEFKFTDNLPDKQRFPKLHIIPVEEIVNYGLAGDRAPPIKQYGGCHLEPQEYHQKIAEENTVIIDVRNHYEANIGRFEPPKEGAKWLDPMMRKSTEFPVWLDKPETKEMLRGKQVLMYCTGGIRCERASALLRQKIDTEEDTKNLGIKGVYQLQGGIDKYFKEFPDGGFWNGKNYVFDKRFAHAPPKVEAEVHQQKHQKQTSDTTSTNIEKQPLGKCESCSKPWDMYRGKRRCPTCGVPSLICKDCMLNKDKKLDKSIRCDLCVAQGITRKSQIKSKEQEELQQYEIKLKQQQQRKSHTTVSSSLGESGAPATKSTNPDNITRLYIGNLCKNSTPNVHSLNGVVKGIRFVQWINDRSTGTFRGFCFVEMKSPKDASIAVSQSGKVKLNGRPMVIKFQPPDAKMKWPPPGATYVDDQTEENEK